MSQQPTWTLVGELIVASGIVGIIGTYWFQVKREKRRVERELNKYKNPLLYAAFRLHKRLDAIFNRLMADDESRHWFCRQPPTELRDRPYFKKLFDERYFVIATVYSVAELIAWIEIFHKTAIRLHFMSSKSIRQFMRYLDLIRIGFCERELLRGLPYEQAKQRQRIFEYFFQSIGETLMFETSNGPFRVTGFSEFFPNYKKDSTGKFRKRFRSIRNLLVDLTFANRENDLRWDRLVAVNYFVKLFLDKCAPGKRKLFRDIRSLDSIKELFYHSKVLENIEKFEEAAGVISV